jgi:hypothetical protein
MSRVRGLPYEAEQHQSYSSLKSLSQSLNKVARMHGEGGDV